MEKFVSLKNKLIPISELSSRAIREGEGEKEKLKHAKSYLKDNDHGWNFFSWLLFSL